MLLGLSKILNLVNSRADRSKTGLGHFATRIIRIRLFV